MNRAENKPIVANDRAKERAARFFRGPKTAHQRIRSRLVQKNGICNISLFNVPKQRRRYFVDIFTTIVEAKWRWTLLCFTLSFLISWTLFYAIYLLIAFAHGDLAHQNDTDWTPCVNNGKTNGNLFIFSFVTQTTIGYGFRYPTAECPLVIMTMCVQVLVGIMCQTLMAGIVFSKLARPIKRAATILYSKNAVICMREGKLCLLFRVGDMRKTILAEAHIRLQMIKKCRTIEGELLPFHQFDMNVGYDLGLDRVFVMWPITVCHEIDENSPFYEISKEGLEKADFEIIVILEGVVESVGSTTQALTSYLPSEILWGKRFERLVTYQRDNGEYRIDFGKFHNVYSVETPECSAKELDKQRESGLPAEIDYNMAPISDSEANDTITALNNQQAKRIPAAPKRDGANVPNRVKIESDDDEEDDGENPITVNVGFTHKRTSVRPQSPEIIGRRTSVRREPDLF